MNLKSKCQIIYSEFMQPFLYGILEERITRFNISCSCFFLLFIYLFSWKVLAVGAKQDMLWTS